VKSYRPLYLFWQQAPARGFQMADRMVKKLPHKENELNARDLQVRFSPEVQDAFRTIAVAARDSKHFDPDIYEIVKLWSSDKPTTVHDVMIALAPIAREVAAHVSATRDEAMKEAWDDLCSQLPENGFKVSQSIQRRR
jgi:hypothetical protein